MKAVLIICLLAGLTAQPALAACMAPAAAPNVPNGATAGRDEMLAALQAVKAYNVVVKNFAECVRKTGGADAQSNAAVDRLQEIADKFNAELRTFKARSGG